MLPILHHPVGVLPFVLNLCFPDLKEEQELPCLCCDDPSVGQCSCPGLPCPPLWECSPLLTGSLLLSMHCRAGEQGHHHTVGAPTSGMNVLVGDGSQQPFPPVLGLQVPVGNSSFGGGGWVLFCFSFPTYTPKHIEACLTHYAMDLYKNPLSVSHTIFLMQYIHL